MTAGGSDRRLVISEDDLAPTPPPALSPTAEHAGAAALGGELPSVEGVRRPAHAPAFAAPAATPAAGGTFFQGIRGQSLLAGVAGIAAGWALTELLGVPDWSAQSKLGTHVHAAVFVAILGGLFALVFNGWNEITARHWSELGVVARRSVPWGAALGAGAGFLASLAYVEMAQRVFENLTFDDLSHLDTNVDLYLVRGLGWAVFGAGVGGATATVVRSRRKLQNGLMGGAVGGAIGGLIFHWLSFQVDDGTMARLLGLTAIGAAVGLAIALVETARREAWLHIVGGGMAGKEFILYESQTSVGASPKCGVTLIKDPAIRPFHLLISDAPAKSGTSARVLTAYEDAAVLVNGAPVTQRTLRDGDVIQVGQTSIRYAERAVAAP